MPLCDNTGHSFKEDGYCFHCDIHFDHIKAIIDAAAEKKVHTHTFHRITGNCTFCGLHASRYGTIGVSGPEGPQGEPGRGLNIWDTIELQKKQIAELQEQVKVLTKRLDAVEQDADAHWRNY